MANLINSGILPLTFENSQDYDNIDMHDELIIEDAVESIKLGSIITVKNITKDKEIKVNISLSARQKDIIIAGGLLNYTKNQNEK